MDQRIGQSALSQLVEQHGYWGGDDDGGEQSAHSGGCGSAHPSSPMYRRTDDVVLEAIRVFLGER